MCCLLLLGIALVVFLVILKFTQVDFTLKFYERFGKKAEDLRGKVVWITGASSGIGENLAYELASVGCKLVLSARREAELERVKTKCCEMASGKITESDVLVLPLDVVKYDTHKDALKTVLDHFDQLDILVNNSGRGMRSLALETDFKVDQNMVEINVLGTISLTKIVASHMVEKGGGHIVVISSISGLMGTPFGTTYSATKFALQGFFNALRIELFEKNVAITSVCPGPIKSNFVANVYHKDGNAETKADLKESDHNRMDTNVFIKHLTVAIANRLDEVWISPLVEMVAAYGVQYMPTITYWISKRFAMKIFKKTRGSREKKDE